MRIHTDAQIRSLEQARRGVYARVRINNAALSLRDMADHLGRNWIKSITWSDDIDRQVQDAQIELALAHHNITLSPFADSLANIPGNLIEPGRLMTIETAVVPHVRGPHSTDYKEVFRGYIDSVKPGTKNSLKLKARDLGKRLQDAWIESDEARYAAGTDTLAEVAMQAVLNEWAPGTTLYTPVSPGWVIRDWGPNSQPVLAALNAIAGQIGWIVRYKWDEGTAQWRLTFYEPDRTKTVNDWTVPLVKEVKHIETADTDVRNRVRVWYSDSSVTVGTPEERRKEIVREDAASITKYGRRYAEISEAATSEIDTAAEATSLAEAVLNDLKEPKAEASVVIPYDSRPETGDLVGIPAQRPLFDQDQSLAVVGVKHTINSSRLATTDLQVRGAPAGYFDKWIDTYTAHPGGSKPANTYPPPQSIPFPTNGGPGVVEVTTPWGGDPRNIPWLELHTAAASGFTATSDTLSGRVKSLKSPVRGPPGVTEWLRAYHENEDGLRSVPAPDIEITYPRMGPGYIDPEAGLPGGVTPEVFAGLSRGDSFPPDGWWMRTGVWGTDASQSLVERRSGAASLALLTASTELVSDWLPVESFRPFRLEIDAKGPIGGALEVDIEWYTSKAAAPTIVTAISWSQGGIGAWETSVATETAPSGATYARIVLRRGSAINTVYVGRFSWQRAPDAFRAYLASGTHSLGGTWSKVTYDTEDFDHGLVWDTGLEQFVARRAGLWSFSVGIQLSGADWAQVALRLNSNRVRIVGSTIPGTDTGEIRHSLASPALQLARGDVVDVVAQGSGGNIETGKHDTWLEGVCAS